MNLMEKAAIMQARFARTMKELSGYEVQTTFYSDFTIADAFGVEAIEDTYDRAFNEWKNNIVYLTELVLVLNHKLWEHYHKDNTELTIVYNNIWQEIDEWCVNNLKDEDADYYYRITD